MNQVAARSAFGERALATVYVPDAFPMLATPGVWIREFRRSEWTAWQEQAKSDDVQAQVQRIQDLELYHCLLTGPEPASPRLFQQGEEEDDLRYLRTNLPPGAATRLTLLIEALSGFRNSHVDLLARLRGLPAPTDEAPIPVIGSFADRPLAIVWVPDAFAGVVEPAGAYLREHRTSELANWRNASMTWSDEAQATAVDFRRVRRLQLFFCLVAGPEPDAPPLFASGNVEQDLRFMDESLPPGTGERVLSLLDALTGLENSRFGEAKNLLAGRTSSTGASSVSAGSPEKSTSDTARSGPGSSSKSS